MAVRGRKPTPTRLKIISGNPGKRPLNQDEPQPTCRAEPPEFLGKTARAEWDRLIIELETLGIITGIDQAILAAYCQAYGRWADAESRLDTIDKTLYRTANGNVQTSPLLWVANRAMEQMLKAAAELGLSPSSRSRVFTFERKEDNRFANNGIGFS